MDFQQLTKACWLCRKIMRLNDMIATEDFEEARIEDQYNVLLIRRQYLKELEILLLLEVNKNGTL